jgi:membrane-associated phospholipid phosphatase
MLMPVIGLFLILNTNTHFALLSSQAKQAILIITFVSTTILPLTLLPLLYQFKIIKSFRMESARERFIPVLITAFFYYTGYLLLKKMGAPPMLNKFIIASLITVVFAAIISYFWKISIHLIGIGGVTGAISALSLRYGIDLMNLQILLLIASALIASARLYLGAHNPKQVYTGHFCGFMLVFGIILAL